MASLAIGNEIHRLVAELYPICRSITGDGLRQSMAVLQEHIPLQVHEVSSGTQVFDWVVPREWNIRDAYVKDPKGRKVIDFRRSNLHIVGYSVPVHEVMPLDSLRSHLFTLADRPEFVPYRTAYYREDWGFCLSHRDYLSLERGDYEVFIDSSLEDGSLTYGELFLQGTEETEVLISSHTCHPSLCNDNLSGIAVATMLARELGATSHRLSYRFVFAPATIGAITWLAVNEENLSAIQHGLVLAGLGDAGAFTYKRSRRGDTEIDRAAVHVLKHSGAAFRVVDFDPFGYDERQYCSPGFDLPVGNLSRTPYGTYPEYHTSADDLDFVTSEKLGEAHSLVMQVFRALEENRTYVSLNSKCEPQLGKRGLYTSLFGAEEQALLWVLNQSDGKHDLLEIAEKSGLGFEDVKIAAKRLANNKLLRVDRPEA